MMNNFPCVAARFIVEGKNLEIKKFTEKMDILPTETREIDDWPDAIKNNANLPEELQPRFVWCICQKEDSCKQVNVPIKKLILQLKGKEQIINAFCSENKLKKTLVITIQSQVSNLPEVMLSPDIVSYFGMLKVEINFDLYIVD